MSNNNKLKASVTANKSGRGYKLKNNGDTPIVIEPGGVLFLNTPIEQIDGLVEKGFIDATEAAERKALYVDGGSRSFVKLEATGIAGAN